MRTMEVQYTTGISASVAFRINEAKAVLVKHVVVLLLHHGMLFADRISASRSITEYRVRSHRGPCTRPSSQREAGTP